MSTQESVEEMRRRLCLVFHRSISNSMTCKKRKLILHFDINKTIVAVDTATGETVQDALNVYLSGMAWGKDKEGQWEISKENLSHSPSDSDEVSFYKFEEKRLLPQLSRDRSTFRGYLSSFTDRPQGSNFKPYLNMLLQKLKWTEPYDERTHKGLTVPGTENCRYHFILPAFYRLINHLVEEERDFSIIFRTYGSDATHVLKSMKSAIALGMPFCQNLKGLLPSISETMSFLKRRENGLFSLSAMEDSHAHNSETLLHEDCLKSDEEMYSTFSQTSGINGVHDDIHAWYENNFHPTKGKPLWIDPTDTDSQHIFFDDNIRPGVQDSIVNLRVRTPSGNFRNVERAEEHKFLHQNIVPVVLSEAIKDVDYFVKELARCEQKYTDHLESRYL